MTFEVLHFSVFQIRKSIRHYFLGSRSLKLGYDILTWAATQLAICYTVMPFLLLAVEPTLIYYRYVMLNFNPPNPELCILQLLITM